MTSLKKNYIYSLLDQLLVFFIPLILVSYTSRTLGADNLGIYSYTISIATVFSTIGRLGLNTYGKLLVAQNRGSSEKRSEIVWQLMSLKLLLTFATVLLYIVFIYVFDIYISISLIMTIYIVADMFDITWLYQGLENFKLVAIRGFAVKTLNLIFVLLLVHNRNDLGIYTFVMEFSVLAANVTFWIGLGQYISDPRIIFNKNTLVHLKKCLIYFVPTVANLIYNILDRVMLGALGQSTVESGYYEQAYKIVTMSHVIVLAMGTVTLPRLTYLHASGKREMFMQIFKRTMSLSCMLLFPMSAGLYFNAELIVVTVLGSEFYGSVAVLKVLSILLFFGSLNYNIGNQILIATERQKQYNTAVIVGAGINSVMNVLLIKRFLAVGAALSSLMAEVLIFFTLIYFANQVVSFKVIFERSILKYVFATVIMVVFGLVFAQARWSSNVVRLVATLISSATVYFSSLLIMKDDVFLDTVKKAYRSVFGGQVRK